MSEEMTIDEAIKIMRARNAKELDFSGLTYALAKTVEENNALKEKLKVAEEELERITLIPCMQNGLSVAQDIAEKALKKIRENKND